MLLFQRLRLGLVQIIRQYIRKCILAFNSRQTHRERAKLYVLVPEPHLCVHVSTYKEFVLDGTATVDR